jgi:hypothetical protein
MAVLYSYIHFPTLVCRLFYPEEGSISLRNIGNDYDFNTVRYPEDTAMNTRTNKSEILTSHMKFLFLQNTDEARVSAEELHSHPQKATGPDVKSSYNYASVHLHYHSIQSYLHDPNSNDDISSARTEPLTLDSTHSVVLHILLQVSILKIGSSALKYFTTPTMPKIPPVILGSKWSWTKHVHLLRQITVLSHHVFNDIFQPADARLNVLKATTMKTGVFWYVMPCSPIDIYQRFGGIYIWIWMQQLPPKRW